MEHCAAENPPHSVNTEDEYSIISRTNATG